MPKFAKMATLLTLGVITSGLLAGCQGGFEDFGLKEKRPVPDKLISKMKARSMQPGGPVMMRIFKQEGKLEVWKQKTSGRYAMLKSYDICKWSGKLGPKFKEGDRQAPEGFYTVNAHQMNPKSSYHLSFNLGYPNKLDKSYRRTGNFLMVHGDCRSAGCYAMTDVLIEEIYALAREAFVGGQSKFQVHAMPFRMTKRNMKKYAKGRWSKFWVDLKRGYDAFEMTAIPPKIDVCERRYLVNAAFPSKKMRVGANEICPPYRTFVPQIVETARGHKIVQAFAGTPDYDRIIRNLAAHTSRTASAPTSRHAVNRSLTTRQSMALRNSIRVSR